MRTDDFQYENNSPKNENYGVESQRVYTLRRESKNAWVILFENVYCNTFVLPLNLSDFIRFKAAAAYFLFMVLSFIYIHNQDVVSFDLFQWFLYVRHHISLAYTKYLRGGYVDIPDSSSVSPILPVFVDDITDFDQRNQSEKGDSLRKAQSLSSLELRSRTSVKRGSNARSKDKQK